MCVVCTAAAAASRRAPPPAAQLKHKKTPEKGAHAALGARLRNADIFDANVAVVLREPFDAAAAATNTCNSLLADEAAALRFGHSGGRR